MNRILLLVLLLTGSHVWAQNDSTRWYVGFTPQYMFSFALRSDLEMLNVNASKVNGFRISPYIYNGYSYTFDYYDNRASDSFDRVSGIGGEFAFKKGLEGGETTEMFGELGIGYHQIRYRYDAEVWTDIELDGLIYTVIRERPIEENISRIDFFALVSFRRSLFNKERLSYSAFIGPVWRLASINNDFETREHRGIFELGSDGFFLKAGVTLELKF